MSSKPTSTFTTLPTPNKASTDKKEYKSLLLENGLRVLLISDSSYDLNKLDLEDGLENDADDNEVDSDERGNDHSEPERIKENSISLPANSQSGLKNSSAGLCVGVGGFSDPWELQGLAHFLEHMVFMGSEKYPDENSFNKFIETHGGSRNATTDHEFTTFYFDIQRKHFKEALDRWAQFFNGPLLKKEAMQREREAVDSEFQMNFQPNDYARSEQILASTAKDRHPLQKFLCGNLLTLKPDDLDDDEVHKKLKDFWLRHYTAQSMTLVVQSQESLDTLEDLVLQSFSSVTNNQKEKELFNLLDEPFNRDDSKFCKIYKMSPMQDTYTLHVTWALPSLMDRYLSKPLQYLSYIIGDQGNGSLISYLRQNAWALTLSAGNNFYGFQYNTTYSAFQISITLTRSGFDNVDRVLLAMFSYLKMMKQKDTDSRIFYEMQKIWQLDFNFGPEAQPIDNVEYVCESMQRYPSERYLTGGQLVVEFDRKLIDEIMNSLNAHEANIFLLSKDYNEIATKQEPWYKTKYIDEEIPETWKEEWKNPPIITELFLPTPNIFIAENVDILAEETCGDEIVPRFPHKIKEDATGEIFYKQDSIFKQPRAIAGFNLRSSLPRKSVENAVCLDLLVDSLNQMMIEDTYPASEALLSNHVDVSQRGGIIITINGLNDKLTLLLQKMLKHLSEFSGNVKEHIFNAVHDQAKKNYYNYFIHPNGLFWDAYCLLARDVHWTSMQKHKVVKNITLEMLKSFSQEFLFSCNIYIQALIQGNVTKEEAVSMYDMVKEILITDHSKGHCVSIPDIRCNEIPDGQSYFRIKGVNPKDTNTLVFNYYQSSHLSSLKNYMLLEVALELMREPVFDTLRTKEQLGYALGGYLENMYGILGVSVWVNPQATKFTADYVHDRIEVFLEWFINEKLKNLPYEEFRKIITTLIKEKKTADVTLADEFNRNWNEITSRDYLFDRRERSINLLKKCKKEEMVEHVTSIIGPGLMKKKLSVQVIGNPDGIKIQDDDDNNDQKESQTAPSNELDPDCVFEMQYLSCDDETLSPHFIDDAETFKEKLNTFDTTYITK